MIFRQTYTPGRLGLSDFTHKNALGITIAGQPLDHMLYHFRLPRSGFRNRCKDEAEDMTERYRLLCQHYGMAPSRNNRGIAHENGAIESPHGHLKREIADALALRGPADFADVTAYRPFIAEIVGRSNARRSGRIKAERDTLQDLPPMRMTDYEETSVDVTSSSCFILKRVFYTVPSRLIGHRLGVRLYDDHLELHIGAARRTPAFRNRPDPSPIPPEVSSCHE